MINVSSSDLNPETLHGLIDRSVKRAPLLNPDPFSALPEKEEIKIDPESLKIYDEAIATLSPQKKIERAISMEKIIDGRQTGKKMFWFRHIHIHRASIIWRTPTVFHKAYRRTSIRLRNLSPIRRGR